MELLHCEKLRKQKQELEKAEMDLVSVSQIEHKLWEMQKVNTRTEREKLSLPIQCLNTQYALRSFQGEYEFSPEILGGKLAEVVYRDATGKIKGRLFFVVVFFKGFLKKKFFSNSVQNYKIPKNLKLSERVTFFNNWQHQCQIFLKYF